MVQGTSPSQIGLWLVSESDPKALYYHMLSKHKFHEALQYSTLHGLDSKVLAHYVFRKVNAVNR